MKTVTIRAMLAVTALAMFAPAPLAAQSVPAPTLVIYGSQKCPTDSNGNEIVVCVRRAPGEQFRIPKELRELKVTPQNESWVNKAATNNAAGANGIGSCSTVGPGGASGCLVAAGRQYKREKQQAKADQRDVEAALP